MFAMGRVHSDSSEKRDQHPTVPKPATPQHASEAPEALVESLQRAAGNAAVGRLLTPRGPASSGDSLPAEIQAKAERKLGTDLSSVRLHADADADSYVRSAKAEAATVGTDVYLGSQTADLSRSASRKTLLHELVHAAQAANSMISPRGVAGAGSGPETEARTIAASGFSGAVVTPALAAPAGAAQLKAIDEDEPIDPAQVQPEAAAEPAVTAEELLNPQVDPDASTAPKPGESGPGESVVYEISIMQPLRAVMSAIDEQDWEKALSILQSIGMQMLNYQNAYEKTNPLLYTTLMSARGWLGMVYQQLNRRLDRDVWSDGQMSRYFKDEVLTEFQRIEGMLP